MDHKTFDLVGKLFKIVSPLKFSKVFKLIISKILIFNLRHALKNTKGSKYSTTTINLNTHWEVFYNITVPKNEKRCNRQRNVTDLL